MRSDKNVTTSSSVSEQLRSQKYQDHIREIKRHMALLEKAIQALPEKGYENIPEIRRFKIQEVNRARFGEPFHTVPRISFGGEWLRSMGFEENAEICTFQIDERIFICVTNKKVPA